MAWGKPIWVSSGYRCTELNTLIGGVKNSHHLLGCAADIIAGNKPTTVACSHSSCRCTGGWHQFIQLIWEGNERWIHILYVPGDLRCQVIGYRIKWGDRLVAPL